MDFSPGDKFVDVLGNVIVVKDVFLENPNADDPNDAGSFEFGAVRYTLNGSLRECEDLALDELLRRGKYCQVRGLS